LWVMSLILAVLGFIELRQGHVPWFGHLPPFVKLDESYMRMLAGARREGVGEHRVQGTYTTSLALSEDMALTMPFVLHFAVQGYHPVIRLAAAASIPIVLATALITQSRLGVLGVGLAFLTYFLLWAILRWRSRKDDLIAPALLLGYPALFALAIAAS